MANMKPYERPNVGVIVVAPSSVLRSMLPRLLAQSGGLTPEGGQSSASEEDTDPRRIILDPMFENTLEELTQLIELTSPVPILVFCEEETFGAWPGQRGVSDLAPEEMPGTKVVGEQILNAVLSAAKRGQSPAPNEGMPIDISTGALLSAREWDVLELLAQGASNKQISEVLSISPNTVYTHVRHIQGKLQTANRTQTALLARTMSGRS